MKILVINGVNLNMLGIREPDLYGKQDYKSLVKFIKICAKNLNVKCKIKQFNEEGKIVTSIQKARTKFDAIVINAGAYTHTSVAILDALKAVALPVAEVHLTDIATREEFRKFSYISLYADVLIKGEGFNGYKKALEFLKDKFNKSACE